MATLKSVDTLGEADLRGKRVLVRADLNVPLEDDHITDDSCIRASVPTIKFLVEKGAKVVVAGHLGSPDGFDLKYSMKPLVSPLSELLGVEVVMANDCIGEEVEKEVLALPEGGVLLLENLRFYKEDQRNDIEFAMMLASVADLYVNDAFIASYMALASTDGVIEFLKPAVSGFSMQMMAATAEECTPRNTVTFCLDGTEEEVLEEWLRCIGHIRAWCKAGGINVDISEFCTGTTKAELYTTPPKGTFYFVLKRKGRSLTFAIEARTLWLQTMHGQNGTFEMKMPKQEVRYMPLKGSKLLNFKDNYFYFSPNGGLGNIRLGPFALWEAFEELWSYNGMNERPEFRLAYGVMVVHLCEAIRIQIVLEHIYRSFLHASVNKLNKLSANSELVQNWSSLSKTIMSHIHNLKSGDVPLPFNNQRVKSVSSIDDAMRDIRILGIDSFHSGDFKHNPIQDPVFASPVDQGQGDEDIFPLFNDEDYTQPSFHAERRLKRKGKKKLQQNQMDPSHLASLKLRKGGGLGGPPALFPHHLIKPWCHKLKDQFQTTAEISPGNKSLLEAPKPVFRKNPKSHVVKNTSLSKREHKRGLSSFSTEVPSSFQFHQGWKDLKIDRLSNGSSSRASCITKFRSPTISFEGLQGAWSNKIKLDSISPPFPNDEMAFAAMRWRPSMQTRSTMISVNFEGLRQCTLKHLLCPSSHQKITKDHITAVAMRSMPKIQTRRNAIFTSVNCDVSPQCALKRMLRQSRDLFAPVNQITSAAMRWMPKMQTKSIAIFMNGTGPQLKLPCQYVPRAADLMKRLLRR